MTGKHKIVIFDDDEANLRLYLNYFKNQYEVKGHQNPFEFTTAIDGEVSAVLIDFNMPVLDGVGLYEKITNLPAYNGCPLFFITASENHEIMHRALQLGCQDFLKRSMTKDEMISRIDNKIDFHKKNRKVYKLGNISLDLDGPRAYRHRSCVDITMTEFKILKYLLQQYPSCSSREEIVDVIWPAQKVTSGTLNTHLSNLRSKFPDWEYEILFIKARGIQLVLKAT